MLSINSLGKRVSPVTFVLAALALVSLMVLAIAGIEAFVASIVVAVLALAGLRQPLVPICAVILSIPVQSEAVLSIGDRTTTWTKLAVIAAVLAFAARFLAGQAQVELTAIGFALGAVVLSLAASFYNAFDQSAWAGEVYRWLIALVIYLIAVEATRDSAFAPVVIGATAMSVIGASVTGIFQAFARSGPETFQARGLTRAYAAFGEPNPFAGYLEMTVPLLFALTLAWLVPVRTGTAAKPPAGWFVGLVVGALALGSIAMALSQSRGGLLGFAAGISTVLLLHGGWTRYAVVGMGAVLILVVALPPFGPRFRGVLATGIGNPSATTEVTTENWAAQERISHWRAGISMVAEYPVLGVGAGNYSEHYRDETKIWRFRIPRGQAHSAYIQAAAQSGIVGLTAYLLLLVAVLGSLVKRLGEAGPETKWVVVGAFGVTVAALVHGFFDYLHVLSLGLQLSIVWAAIEIIGRSYAPRWPRHEAFACQP